MKLKVFSILDLKAGFFQVPFFMPSVGQAMRAVSDLCGDPSSIISRHPGDFALYELGEWEDATAVFEPHVPMRHLGGGEQFMPRPSGFDAGNP